MERLLVFESMGRLKGTDMDLGTRPKLLSTPLHPIRQAVDHDRIEIVIQPLTSPPRLIHRLIECRRPSPDRKA